jgi:hypothetical protein
MRENTQEEFFQSETVSARKSDEARELIQVNRSYELDVANRPNFSVEANFMLLPIFSFDKKQTDKSGRITHSVPVLKNGTVIKSKISVSTAETEKNGKLVREGLPGSFDMQVLFCLMDLWDEQGRAENGVVNFRLNTVCTRLKMNDSGRSYEQIKNSIKKLCVTKIESTNAYYSEDRADYISMMMNILDDATIVSSRGSTKVQDACSVKIGRHILTNLLKSYTATINRKIYQQLDVGFAQRILCLVLFKQQIENEAGVIDFELMDLASLIPISGKLYPSTIMSRLEKALSELEEKKVYRHEYLKSGKSHVLRLIPFEQPENFLLGSGHLERFNKMVRAVYKTDLMESLQMTDEALERKLDKDQKVIEYGGRKYSKVYHVIDVLLCMVKGGYQARNPSQVLKAMLEKTEDSLDYPDHFVPIDLQYKKILAQEQLTRVVTEKEKTQNDADDALYRTAFSYVKFLTPKAREAYLNRLNDVAPLMKNSPQLIDAEIAELVFQDMKAGDDMTKSLTQDKNYVRLPGGHA